MDDLARLTLGRMQHPVRGLLHGGAGLASVVGAVLLWTRASGDLSRQLALLVFGLSLVALYTASTLYHSVPWRPLWKARMQRLDHSMIYVLVAGTYTPIAVIVLDGWVRTAALAIVWGIAAVGVGQKIVFPRVSNVLSVTLQVVQGWFGLALAAPLLERMAWEALALVALGGVAYTVGVAVFVTQRPRLWPRLFSYHEVFHVLVVAGSAVHWAVAFEYLTRFALP